MTGHRLSFPLEVKRISEREFEGYGSTFGNVDHVGDIVMRGAFKRSLAAHRKAGTLPLMFFMHNPTQVPGVWKQMREDENGLYVKGELVDTQLGNETRELLLKKAVRGLSIGFGLKDVDFDDDGNRLLKEIELWEVSVVSLAANPLAEVEAVKARLSASGEYVPTQRELERSFQSMGFSRNVAVRMCAKVLGGEVSDDPSGDGYLPPPHSEVAPLAEVLRRAAAQTRQGRTARLVRRLI